MHRKRPYNCWSLRCSWSITCRRCSNYIFILGLTPGFSGLGTDNCKTEWETFKFWDSVCLILEVWQQLTCVLKNEDNNGTEKIGLVTPTPDSGCCVLLKVGTISKIQVTQQPSLGLLSWHPVMWSSHRYSSEDWAPVDFIYRFLGPDLI